MDSVSGWIYGVRMSFLISKFTYFFIALQIFSYATNSIFSLLMQSNFLFLPIKKIEKPTLCIEETLMLLDRFPSERLLADGSSPQLCGNF